MTHRLLFVGAALLVAASGCAKDATSRVKDANKAAVAAEEEKFQVAESQEDLRESQNDAKKEAFRAETAVNKEKAKVRGKLDLQIADANAKLAPPASDKQPNDTERARLNQKKEVLTQDMKALDETDYKEWPTQKKKIEADIDRFE